MNLNFKDYLVKKCRIPDLDRFLKRRGLGTGIVLVEVLLATTLLGVILVPTLNFMVTAAETSWFASRETKAQVLVREQLEALRSIRQRNWGELRDGTFYATPSAGKWQLVENQSGETVDSFTRKIEIASAWRNDQDQIVADGQGRLDPSTKKVTLTVNWHSLRDRTLSYVTYLTRYLDNLIWKQTTKAEFDQGVKDLTKTVDPPQEDGEVVLMGGCPSGSPGSLIYDDQLRNGWRVNCNGLPFIQWLLCKLLEIWNRIVNNGNTIKVDNTSPTYNGSSYSIKLILNPSGWSYAGIYNYNGICTIGFKNLHFYAYNPSAQPITLYVTAVYGSWDRKQVSLPPGGWTEVTLDYQGLGEGYETNLQAIYFSVNAPSSAVTLYIDQIELTGGVGGYFTKGTLTSSILDAGRQTAFNRIGFRANLPSQTSIGFQVATANAGGGPWVFYGPGGTTSESDLYNTASGSGLWLGNNLGQYLRYKAYLISGNGVNTPTLYDVSVNYAP